MTPGTRASERSNARTCSQLAAELHAVQERAAQAGVALLLVALDEARVVRAARQAAPAAGEVLVVLVEGRPPDRAAQRAVAQLPGLQRIGITP
jgi:hypothetical protein